MAILLSYTPTHKHVQALKIPFPSTPHTPTHRHTLSHTDIAHVVRQLRNGWRSDKMGSRPSYTAGKEVCRQRGRGEGVRGRQD